MDNRCLRCREGSYIGGYCDFCGVAQNRPVRRIRRRIIGGKRGRNSGVTGYAKKKK